MVGISPRSIVGVVEVGVGYGSIVGVVGGVVVSVGVIVYRVAIVVVVVVVAEAVSVNGCVDAFVAPKIIIRIKDRRGGGSFIVFLVEVEVFKGFIDWFCFN